ncbi:helix-turn-helix domain-containing protein [Daejeonella sp.]|uniref:helix-turn-helix domain-containing protein n=1 Tax=Daejeonella sp. TaxID=2805397 RepID=UPI0030C40866
METLTFDQLPQAVSLLHEKISHIEQLLLEGIGHQDNEELFNITKAAEFLNLSVATLYGKVCRKEIPVNKQGKRLYFYKAELADWIKSGRKKTITELREEAQLMMITRRRK